MSSIGLAPAELAGLVLESCLTGIALPMFCAAIYVLACKRGLSSKVSTVPFNKVLFTVTILLLLAVLAHWAINVARAFSAFIYDSPNPGATYVFGTLADPKNVAKTALYIFEMLLADCILIYRLYIVWSRNRLIIIAPVITTIGTVVSGVTISYIFSTLAPQTVIFDTDNGRWILSCFASTLCTNLYATPMIAYKIWTSNRAVRSLGPSKLMPAIQIVVESAAIYLVITFVTFVLYLSQSNLQFPTLDSTSPIMGIVFCMIIVRAELGIAYGHSHHSTSVPEFRQGRFPPGFTFSTGQVSLGRTRPQSQVSATGHSSGDDKMYPLQSIAVHVTREVDVHEDMKARGLESGLGSESEICTLENR